MDYESGGACDGPAHLVQPEHAEEVIAVGECGVNAVTRFRSTRTPPRWAGRLGQPDDYFGRPLVGTDSVIADKRRGAHFLGRPGPGFDVRCLPASSRAGPTCRVGSTKARSGEWHRLRDHPSQRLVTTEHEHHGRRGHVTGASVRPFLPSHLTRRGLSGTLVSRPASEAAFTWLGATIAPGDLFDAT